MRALLLIALIFVRAVTSAQNWKPNILVIVLDDCRYDAFTVDGGASFFQSSAINRIANEGVRFQYCFPAFSLCSPSRASITTGLYPHHHKVIANAKNEVDSFDYPTPAKILHSKGYYTGFIGKYGYAVITSKDSFDYKCESSSDFYWNSSYYYNSKKQVVIPGHKTDILTSKTIEFLNLVPTGKHFLLYLEHKAPHEPYTQRTIDSGIYANSPIPYPANYYRLDTDIPSHYNDCYTDPDTIALKNSLEGYYELLAGAEASIDTVLTYLQNKGMLDSTLIIFTSDNGLMLGEHIMDGKEIALEESIRLPMFIRYPRWFSAGTVISDQMAMNIDIAPTILEAAGIPDTFGMDGMSLHNLVRKQLFYEYFSRACLPTLTAVRDFNYKYISNRCSSVSEEFYDLSADPNENTNLINKSSLATLIQSYRVKMDSLKGVYGYSLVEDTTLPCCIVSCAKPTGMAHSTITSTSAIVNWTNQNCNYGYKLQYRKQGVTSWTTIKPAANVNSYNITGLLTHTTYEWRVAENCDGKHPSMYSKYCTTQTFTTL